MQGQLFTHYFLTDGIRTTTEWKAPVDVPEEFASFRKGVSEAFASFAGYSDPNEAFTEQDLIRPILELLGWTAYMPQQGSARNEDIPDHLLFEDEWAKARAASRKKPADRFQDALLIEESKRYGLPLGYRDKEDKVQTNSPHGQILRYLRTAEDMVDDRIRWGILTNGAAWRLYDNRTRPRSGAYYEVDVPAILEENQQDELRTFFLLFRRQAFTLGEGATTTFVETALAEGRRYEERVAKDLSGVVFRKTYPSLVTALAEKSDAPLSEVRDAALIFLYRLLFVLYAEDRGLLPVNDARYADYGLRKRVRDGIARKTADRITFSDMATVYYDRLASLFRQIDQGDPSIGLPPYNGGLFSTDAAPLLQDTKLADSVIAPIVYGLSHTNGTPSIVPGTGRIEAKPRFVNYRDMSVQQLGSIYERLMEREPVREDDGTITVRPNPYARKDSGSFYTPQELVDLIIDQTLKPLAEERLRAFEAKAKELKSDRRPKAQRRAELEELDPAEAVLELKVLDPAMGSGHFLVNAVDFLSDYISDLLEYTAEVPDWLNGGYESPLVKRIAAIREDIVKRATESHWIMDESLLTDQAIIRRMVLKRCIYGVDKNPLTVELAKVSLWLHSFTVGAPLSFLDHHLRCGDSLIGLRVAEANEHLRQWGGLFASGAIAAAEASATSMQRIEEMSDADVAEVQESAALFKEVEQATSDLRGLLDFVCGMRWQTAGMKSKLRKEFEAPLVETLSRDPKNTFKLLAKGPKRAPARSRGKQRSSNPAFRAMWNESKSIAGRERVLHWEAAFPGVWHGWQDDRPNGGFDAVIGNPPWDRIKLQEVEWFATREPEISLATTAAARRTAIGLLRKKKAPLAAEFDDAKARADDLSQMVRKSGHYPLLGGGDINLYSLFVERAKNLVKPEGFVGLLTPSGIYADKTAAKFFKSISTSGRLASLFDFENRRRGTDLPPFFPDVDSRFKFCAIAFGGEGQTFAEAMCGFFLHGNESITDPDHCFPLEPGDFAKVNPNTGTAPIFRTRRDAEITRRIYEQHPVLVDRSRGDERRAWPVRYYTMFHMTNDSGLFRTAAQLDSDGFYPVEGNRWQRGDELRLPLYQGRMIWHFDHRANSVSVNPENPHNPYLSKEVSEAQHSDPSFLPQSEYWVPARLVEEEIPRSRGYALGFRDITNPTNMRTMAVSVVPWAGYGNKLPLLLPIDGELDARGSASLLANLNSFGFDYVTRQKIQGTSLNWYIVEQLPVIAQDGYERRFGNRTAGELVRDHVLRLTFTSDDMFPFARDLGYTGLPFTWDAEERRHLRARLDALYFHLYGLSRDDTVYILDTFPIVRRQDEKEFGDYRTKRLVLAYMNALAAGDTETEVKL